MSKTITVAITFEDGVSQEEAFSQIDKRLAGLDAETVDNEYDEDIWHPDPNGDSEWPTD